MIAAAAGGGAWYYFEHRRQNDRSLVLQGNVDVRQVNLAFKVEGRIESLTVDEGDRVEANQLLATLDKRYFEDELRLARARHDNQKAVVERLEHGSRPEEIAEARAAAAKEATLAQAKDDYVRKRRLEKFPGAPASRTSPRRAARRGRSRRQICT